MSKKDWQVGPVLKDKLGSQGTLFRGGTKYSSDARYPRGYTPERLNEVAEEVGSGYARGQGAKSPSFRDHRYVDPRTKEVTGRANNKPKREVVDTVARSTIPIEHLQARVDPGRRLNFWIGGHVDKELGEQGNAGTYLARPPTHSNRSDIRLSSQATTTDTPIHEIGHHWSAVQRTPHSAPGSEGVRTRTGADRGNEEAYADSYAEQHYRNRKGQQEMLGTYGGGQFAGRIQRSDDFWKSYHQNRDNSLYAADVDRQNEDYYAKYPEERVHPDQSMDVPLINKEYVATGEEKTTHQPMDINWEAEPDPWHRKYTY